MQKHNTRGVPAAQPLSADSLPLPSISPNDGAPGTANEPFSRRQLKLFEQRCQTLAHRVACNQLNFIDAVDMAYDAATWSGLADAVGDDVVQETMARAFMKVSRP
jgi:hypothetical protein